MPDKKKGLFSKLTEKIDSYLKKKAKAAPSSCCGPNDKEDKNNCCSK